MGKLEPRQRLTVVRRLWGHDLRGPSGVLAQSIDRTNSPISPPPTSQSAESTSFRASPGPSVASDTGILVFCSRALINTSLLEHRDDQYSDPRLHARSL